MIVLAIFLVVSLAYNFHQHKESKKKHKLSVDARQLLHDLTNSGAVVRVTVLDPTGLLYYRGGA